MPADRAVRLADVVDAAMEAAVVPSFTRIGPAVRSQLEHWAPPVGDRIDGRVVVITGATSGLGLTAARALLRGGALVEIVARNPEKLAATVTGLREEIPDASVHAVVADTGDLDEIRRAAADILSRRRRVDVLVHNAGALADRYVAAAGGLEQTVASQVVGPFLLSALMAPALAASAPGRILWVTSGGMYTEALSVALLDAGPAGFRGATAYARAKRAQVTLAELMAAKVDPARLVVHAVHPGWALTPGLERSLPGFKKVMGPLLRTPEEGADTLVWLAANDGEPTATSGRLWLDRRVRTTHRSASTRRADTRDERSRLWAWVTEAAGTEFPSDPLLLMDPREARDEHRDL